MYIYTWMMSLKDNDRSVSRRFDDEPTSRPGADEATVKNEVKRIIKEHGQLTPAVMQRLRTRYGNNDRLVDAIVDSYTDSYSKIKRVAAAFLDKYFKVHSMGEPTHIAMKRLLKYKVKYELSEEEFDEIRKLFNQRLYGNDRTSVSDFSVNTNMSKVLGHGMVDTLDGVRTSSNEDFGFLQEIHKVYAHGKMLHSQVVLQTLSYENIDTANVLTIGNGVFTRASRNVFHHAHPLLVALFVPKFADVENRMLLANIAGIVSTRAQKMPIRTKPDFDLFYALIVDPNDAVCGNGTVASPMSDLLDRARAQAQLWTTVLFMRQGKFYEPTNLDLVVALDQCKISNLDNPDLVYLSDEGILLRRLFSIFAFRPIVVVTRPALGVPSATNPTSLLTPGAMVNPYAIPMMVERVTSMPFITIRLPYGSNATAVDIDKLLLETPQFFLEGNSFVFKSTSIVHLAGPLVVHIPRKVMRMPFNAQFPFQYNFLNLAYNNTLRHFNNVNENEVKSNLVVDVADNIRVRLRSLVYLEAKNETADIRIHTHSNALLFKYKVADSGLTIDNFEMHNYAPMAAITDASGNSITMLTTTKSLKNSCTVLVFENVAKDYLGTGQPAPANSGATNPLA